MAIVGATRSLEQAAQCRWGAVVVGAGPAGALVARQLSDHHISVLLVDRAEFPRTKVCGCCLGGAALAALAAAGLGELPRACGAVPMDRIVLRSGRRCAEVPLVGGAVLSRNRFDAALVDAATQAGAAFMPATSATLRTLTADGREIVLRQGDHSVRVLASVVIAADGIGGGLLGRAGVAPSVPEAGSHIGLGAVSAKAPDYYQTGAVYMACGAHGYIGLVRLEDGSLDLAAAVDAGWLRTFHGAGWAAQALLQDAGLPVPANLDALRWHGTPALTRRPRRLAGERVFAVGDAAGYIEPFTGEGMGWALAGALALAPLAARATHDWDPSLTQVWPQVLRRATGRRLLCRAAACVLRRPGLTRAAITCINCAPFLARQFVRQLNAPSTYNGHG